MNECMKKFQALCSPNPGHRGSHLLYYFLLTADMKQLETPIWIFMKFETGEFYEKALFNSIRLLMYCLGMALRAKTCSELV
jgi:hypothetical protein